MRYSRSDFKDIITDPKDGAQFLDHLSGNYSRLVRALELQERYRVRAQEDSDLPKLSARFYNTVDLWWVIGLFNGMTDFFTQLEPGTEIKIPSLASIDAYIRESRKKSVGGVVVLN